MKTVRKIFVSIVLMSVLFGSVTPSIVTAGEVIRVTAESEVENGSELKIKRDLLREVQIIYKNLIKYDLLQEKFIVDNLVVTDFYQNDVASVQGVYLLKDSLNEELLNNPSLDKDDVLNQKIEEMTFIINGGDESELITNSHRSKRADFSWIERCIKEAWGVTISFVSLKGVVNLFKAGKFEAAAAKLAATTAGRIAGVAALVAFLATCGAETVSK